MTARSAAIAAAYMMALSQGGPMRGGQPHYPAHPWSASAGRLVVTDWLPRTCCHSERANDAACEGCCNRGEK